MTTRSTNGTHPGLMVGPTSEFSLFFRITPGRADDLRAALQELQQTPGYRPGEYDMAIQTIHEARFVLFNNDTQLAFITSFDGPWEAYMEDFFTSGPTLGLFDAIFGHVEGYDGLPNREALRAFILGAEEPAAIYARNYGARSRRTGRLSGSTPPSRRCSTIPRPPKPSNTRRWRRCWTRRPTRRRVASRCPTTSPVRARWPTRSPTSLTSTRSQPERPDRLVLVMNTLPFAQPDDLFSDGLVYGSACARSSVHRGRWHLAVRVDGEEVVSTAPSRPRQPKRRRTRGAGGHLHGDARVHRDVPRGRARGRSRTGGPRLRRTAVGPVHHGRPGRAEHDRDANSAFTDHGTIFLDGKNVLSLVVELAPSSSDTPTLGVSPRPSPAVSSTSGSSGSAVPR